MYCKNRSLDPRKVVITMADSQPSESGEESMAYKLLKSMLKEKGITLSSSTIRELKNQAKKLGIPEDEMLKFVRAMTLEIVDEIFSPKEDK